MGRNLKILLVASLVLNLFLVGAAAGVLLVRSRLADIAGPPPRGGPFMQTARKLSPQGRALVREAMRAQAPQIEPLLRESREARREVVAVFAAPTFDSAQATAAMARARAAEGRARAKTEETLIQVAATLQPADREIIGKGLRGGALRRALRQANGPDGPAPSAP